MSNGRGGVQVLCFSPVKTTPLRWTMSSLSSSSHAVACICVVGAQNQCLFLRRLVPRRDDTSAPSESGAAEQSEKKEHEEKVDDEDDQDADDDLFKLHLLAHSALDVVQERCASTSSSAGTAASSPSNSFLGLLFPTEEHRVYGYVCISPPHTHTHTHTCISLSFPPAAVRFRSVHVCVCTELVCLCVSMSIAMCRIRA